MADLNRLLSQEQISDLKMLARQREWASMLTLFRNLLELEYQTLASFSSANEAFELRGRVQGVRDSLDVIRQLYDGEKDNAGTGTVGTTGHTTRAI